MTWVIRASAVGALVIVSACGGGGGQPIPLEPNGKTDSPARYFGSGPSDVWAASTNPTNEVAHWDGSSWKLIPTQAQAGAYNIAYAGPHKAWIASSTGVWRVDATGAIEDFSADVPLSDGASWRAVVGGETSAVVWTKGPSLPTQPKVYVFDGAHFGAVSFPVATFFTGGLVRSKDDVYVTTLATTEQSAVAGQGARELTTSTWHWDGASWSLGTDNQIGAAATHPFVDADPHFPKDDVWFNCGDDALHFDGAVIRRLGVPLPPKRPCFFSYANKRPSITFEAVGSPATQPEAYQCNTEGTVCTLLDVPGSRTVEWHRMDWDGKQWMNDRVAATVNECAGAACGYNGGPPAFGVYGYLDDGTEVFAGMNTDGKTYELYLVAP